MAIETTVVLAMTVDGKISAVDPKAPRDSDAADQAHLEYQTSLADVILIGAGTIRAEGTAYTIRDPELLAARAERGQPAQPITCIVSQSLDLDPGLPIFSQDIERWIFTTGAALARNPATPLAAHARLLAHGKDTLDWNLAYQWLEASAVRKIAALGGGSLTAALLEARRVDDLWLTIWPVIYGGRNAPSPVEGPGFDPRLAPHLQLIEMRRADNEIFLHYRVLARD